MKPAPDWLAEFQRRFGEMLRTPLDRATGTLRATVETYDGELVRDVLDAPNARASDRLAVYQRQYWFRLFTVLQSAYPLTAHLAGAWQFNDYAARFLAAHPPRGWDIEHAAHGFEEFLAGNLANDNTHGATLEAAHLDAAWRALLRAPPAVPFQPRPEEAARLLDSRLDPSPSALIFLEHWPLLETKRSLGTTAATVTLAALDRPRWWVLVREGAGIRQTTLEPREGELLELLCRHTVRDALAYLEADCSEAERAELPARAQQWLARSVQRGLWRGVVATRATTE